MSKALSVTDLDYLDSAGFSEKQAKALLRLTEEQIKEYAVTEKDIKLTHKELELVKKSLMVWLGGMIISAFIVFSGYLSWLVLYMDNKNQEHASARFDQVSSQMVQMDKHFERRFEQVDKRFERVESDIKDIKSDIKEIKEVLLSRRGSRGT